MHPRGMPSHRSGVLVAAGALAAALAGCAGAESEQRGEDGADDSSITAPAAMSPDGSGATSPVGPGAPSTEGPAARSPVGPDGQVEVIEVYARGPGFTQGLELLDDGQLLHSTGRYDESAIEILTLDGDLVAAADLPADEFGEGVTVAGDTAYQLTWTSGVVHTWSLPDLAPGPQLSIEGEGWGLCHDETRDVLWLSDGSAQLQALDLDGLVPGDRVEVSDQGKPVPMLNELECVDGRVWANIWHGDEVVRIDPATGAVTGRVDLSGVVGAEGAAGEEDVLNGIAYDESDGTFLVTGKSWAHIYRVRLPSAAD